MARLRCEYCGGRISETESYCSHCGAEISRSIDSSGEQSGLSSREKLDTCSDCGERVSARAPFCPHCGAPHNKASTYQRSVKPDWGFEWRSQAEIMGYPLVHVAVGRKDGKLRVAKGIIAIGQFAFGLITFAQFGVGLLFGFGQFIFGFTAIAQFAIAIYFGLGQFATGYIAIGQLAFGYYALGQVALGKFIWKPEYCDPEAKRFFMDLARSIGIK